MNIKSQSLENSTNSISTSFIPVEKLMWALSIVVISLYLAPYLLLGGENKWMIWDNLDSSYVWYSILAESGKIFASNSTIIEQPMGGLPRSVFPSEFDAFTWLFLAFGPETAYILNRVIITLTAFFGMYLLIKKHILVTKADRACAIGVALCFSLLPFYPFGGLSVAGQPFVLFAFLNIRNGNNQMINWMILFIYPFYSSLVLSGIFFLFLLALIWVSDSLRGRKSSNFFFALILVSLVYVFSHYRLFIEFLFFPEFTSHRVEFMPNETSIIESLRKSAKLFIKGQGHSHTLQYLIILPFVVMCSILLLLYGSDKRKRLFITISLSLVLISFFHGFINWPPLVDILKPVKAFIPMQLDRFYFLSPMLWMILFAICLATFCSSKPVLRHFLLPIIMVQVLLSAANHEWVVNRGSPTVQAFFAERQFDAIKQKIGRPIDTYRVASIGLHPSISLYNGFYSVDGYFVNYPLAYKHKFQEIIMPELTTRPDLLKYFDNWGSRAYLFNSELGRDVVRTKRNGILLNGADYNWDAFYDLGGRYIFSAVEIDFQNTDRVTLIDTFSQRSSAWVIWVYSIAKIGEKPQSVDKVKG